MKKRSTCFIWALLIMFFMGCSTTDPLDVPIDATSVDAFGKSVVKIAKKLENPEDHKRFMAALDHVALGVETLLSLSLYDPTSSSERRERENFIKMFHGKTARQIIATSDLLDEMPIDEFVEKYGTDPDMNHVIGDLLDPKKNKEREMPDLKLEHQRAMTSIANKLRLLRSMKDRYIRTNNLGKDTMVTKYDLIDFAGGEHHWPRITHREGIEFIMTDDGEPACVYNGDLITNENLGEYWEYRE